MIKIGRLKHLIRGSPVDVRYIANWALGIIFNSQHIWKEFTKCHPNPEQILWKRAERKQIWMNRIWETSLYLSARNSWSKFFKETALLIHEINNLKDFIRQIYFFARLSCHNKIDTYMKLKNASRNDKCLICSVMLFGLLLCLLNDFSRSLIKLDCFSYFLKTVDFHFRYVQ